MPSSTHAKPYLAFDFGAESGRAVLAHLRSGILTTEEVHRFPNEPVEYGGSLHWDLPRLWLEVRKILGQLETIELESIGVDAWGVDYALLGERGELLQNPYHYRDRRTEGVMEEVFEKVAREEIYQATGIQFMPINTLYQLFAARRAEPKLLKTAKQLVTIPDLFHYWLCGNAVCEFTNATTTQMVDPIKRGWATSLMQRLDLPAALPAPLVDPGTILGTLLPGIAGDFSLTATVIIAPACHDTGSAVAAVSAREGTAFISSGTWSLVGTELDSPLITADALRLNFTNEGGVNRTTRLLKNVMGLWLLQGCRQSWAAQGHSYDHRELIEMAAGAPPFRHLVDPDDESFLRPANMLTTIDAFGSRTSQPSQRSCRIHANRSGESGIQVSACSSGSRTSKWEAHGADSYPRRRIQESASEPTNGGCNGQENSGWSRGGHSTRKHCSPASCHRRRILPAEARDIVDRSFPTEIFEPRETDKWDAHAGRFEQYCESVYA